MIEYRDGLCPYCLRPLEEETGMMNISFSNDEIDLLTEALSARAGRHESMSRFNPRGAGSHDRKAKLMRKLCDRLLQERKTAA